MFSIIHSNDVEFEEVDWRLNISGTLPFAFGIWGLEAGVAAGTYLGLSQTLCVFPCARAFTVSTVTK